jgi:hypothetical protein
MSLRISVLFCCLSILSHGVPTASFAQEEGGLNIEGPFEGSLAAPVEMNSDLRDLPIEVPLLRGEGPVEVPLHLPSPERAPIAPGVEEIPFVPQSPSGPFGHERSQFSNPDPNFDGIQIGDEGAGFIPPDTNGDVGPNHYVQAVNSSIAVYDKQGNTLAGPMPINALFAPLGGTCATGSIVDPIVNYDPLADRWIVSGIQSSICIAVSKTGDPVSGGWFLYEFDVMLLPDYPKLGVWPDAYYLSTQRGSLVDVFALERRNMLDGDPAQFVHFVVEPPFLLPADLDGRPPRTPQLVADLAGRPQHASAPAPFIRHIDGDLLGGMDRLEIFEFQVDFEDPASSTFRLVASLPTEPFSAVLCGDTGFGFCAEQPNGVTLETLPIWSMWRFQYRNFGSHESLVANHTVAVESDLGEGAGIRWYELRRRHGRPWVIFQQGTFAPQDLDATAFLHRFMGSIAMDKKGNIALGFSASSSTVVPSVRYVGRVAKDPLGILPRGGPSGSDVVMFAGEGASIEQRWGDYSSMSVDPADGCTFWYAQQYAGTFLTWKTRIGAFRFPSCH